MPSHQEHERPHDPTSIDDGVPSLALSGRACSGAMSPGTGGRCETRSSRFGYGPTVIRERDQSCHPGTGRNCVRIVPVGTGTVSTAQRRQPGAPRESRLEILIVLLERPGELISMQELMARVWPNTFVDPGNLTVHISALRRTLRDGRDGNRFIINIPGRGYSFVASVEISKLKGHRSKMTWAPTLHKFRSFADRRTCRRSYSLPAALKSSSNRTTGNSDGHGNHRGSNGGSANANADRATSGQVVTGSTEAACARDRSDSVDHCRCGDRSPTPCAREITVGLTG